MARTLTVYLAADTAKFRSAMRNAADVVDGPEGLHGKINSLGLKLTDYLGGALIGASAALGAFAIKMGVDGVQAAIDDQAAVERLTAAMQNLGLANDTTSVLSMIDAMQRQYGVSEEQLRPAFERLVTSLKNSNQALDVLKLAMDVSAGTGKSLETVVAALGKAYDGNTGGLQRLGAGLDSAILKTGDMDLITAALAQRFGGQALTNAGTYQGAINRLSIGFDELKESFGQGFLDGLNLADTTTANFTTTMKQLEPVVTDAGNAIGNAVTTIASLTAGIKDSQIQIDEFLKSTKSIRSFSESVINSLGPVVQMVNSLYNAWINAKAAMDAYNNVHATPNGPGDVGLLTGGNSTSAGTPSNYVFSGSSGGLGSSKPLVNINVNAVVADPVAVANTVNKAMITAAGRLGRVN